MQPQTSIRAGPDDPGVVAESIVLVGIVGGPFGTAGWTHVKSYTQPPENLLGYSPWQLRRAVPSAAEAVAGHWEVVEVEAQRHAAGLIARFADARDRDSASVLRGVGIGVDANVLPPAEDDEYYWRDLVDAQVVNRAGTELGRVVRLFATPAHDVLVVADAAGEWLIPFVREWVVAVAGDAKRVVVDWEADWR